MKLSNILKASALALAVSLTVGCGQKVEVPPGHVAKIMTKDGYQETLIPSSMFRLPFCTTYCDKLVVLDTTDRRYSERLEIFIPKDKLNIKLNIDATLRVDGGKAKNLFAQLPQSAGATSQDSLITGATVYNTYGKQVMEAEVRSYLTQFSIGEISSNIEKINTDIRLILQKVMSERTPFVVVNAGFTNIEFPPTIVNAQIASAERREAVAKEEAQLEVSKVTLERELKEAQLQRQIEKEKAETEAIKQRAVAESITPQYLKMRELEVQQEFIKTWDGKFPQTYMGNGSPTSLLMNMSK